MIDHDDMPTIPHTPSQADDNEATTIEVAAEQNGATAAPAPAAMPTSPVAVANPFVSVNDLLAIQLAGDPQISPRNVAPGSGPLIAFVIQKCDAEKNSTSSAIWLVSSSGSKTQPAWQVTGGEHHDFAPRWSPDGRTLAFLSDRDGSVQLYLLPLNGGEARKISNLRNGVTGYSWKPDGSAILVGSLWKPADDKSEDKDKVGSSEIACVYTRLDEQWDGIGYKHNRHQQLWLIPLEGEAIRITSEPVDLITPCWSPDGSEVAFCANRRPDPDLSVSMALWVLTLATGQMRRLTPEEGLAQMPAWSPDGRSIAYYYAPDQTEASNILPWIVDATGQSAPHPAVQGNTDFTCLQWIIDELHSSPLTPPQWYPDNKTLLITVQEHGQIHLYRVDTEQGQMTKLTGGNGCYTSPALSQDGQTIAMIRSAWFTPGDIWAMDSNGTHLRKLTGVNDTFLRGHQLIRPKTITWKSFDGLDIEGWLYLPPLPEGTKAPLILEVHGGPTLAWGDAYVHEFQVLAGHGFAVLAANPRGSSGYGEAFCKKVLNDWGGDDFRDLMAGVDYVIANEPVDGNRLGIGGLSYGGYMTLYAITQTQRFKAAVSRNGISSLLSASTLSDQALWFDLANGGEEPDAASYRINRSALTHADQITTPLLLLHAENDLRCPFIESYQMFVQLRKLKRTVELVRYPQMSHMMDFPELGTPNQRVDRLRRTVSWFEHFV
jgi:dipeptidyl aminopeptidase/acylaminoacyl peptidase